MVLQNPLPLRTRLWFRKQQHERFLHPIDWFSACKWRYRTDKSRLQSVSLRTNCAAEPFANKENKHKILIYKQINELKKTILKNIFSKFALAIQLFFLKV